MVEHFEKVKLVYDFFDVFFPYFAVIIFYSAIQNVCNVVEVKNK